MLWLVALLSSCTSIGVAGSVDRAETYRAAVVELAPRGTAANSATQNLALGLAAVDSFAGEAAKAGALLVVFPEAVLWTWGFAQTGDGMLPRDKLREYGAIIPAVGSVPCEGQSQHGPANTTHAGSRFSTVAAASCIAVKHRIVLVVNTIDVRPCTPAHNPRCPEDGRYQYNTDVVLDGGDDGRILAVYHKFHLYYTSPLLDRPAQPEIATFETSFGIRFGVLICFDAEFRHPVRELLATGVRHIIFSTSWFNSPPLFTATMFQQGFSRLHGVTVLAANTGATGAQSGSGIYSCGDPLAVHFDHDELNVDKVVIADVPRMTSPPLPIRDHGPRRHHAMEQPRGIPSARNSARTTTGAISASPASPAAEPCSYTTPSLFAKGRCVTLRGSTGPGTSATAAVGNFTCTATAIAVKTGAGMDDGGGGGGDGGGSYVLFASSGNVSFGSAGGMFVQTCAVIFCARTRSAENLVCDGVYAGGNTTFTKIDLLATFRADAQVFPMVAVGPAQLLPTAALSVTSIGGLSYTPPEKDNGPLFSAVLYGLSDETHS